MTIVNYYRWIWTKINIEKKKKALLFFWKEKFDKISRNVA